MDDEIIIEQTIEDVELIIQFEQGEQGVPGVPGAPGAAGGGTPDGGNTDEVLTKNSGVDQDFSWKPAKTSYHHVQGVAAAVWTVNHGLGYKPGGILVEDSGGSTWEGEIDHVDNNTLTLTFGGAFSGDAYLS